MSSLEEARMGFWTQAGAGVFSLVLMFFYVGYYVFVPCMLWMIWKKVRHLPG
jgi:hypothetical protein